MLRAAIVVFLVGCGSTAPPCPPLRPPLPPPPSAEPEEAFVSDDSPPSLLTTDDGLAVVFRGRVCSLAPWLGHGPTRVEPALHGSIALLALAGPRLLAIDLATCRLGWSRERARWVAVAFGHVWVGDEDRHRANGVSQTFLRALDASAGEERLAVAVPAGVVVPLSVSEERLVVASRCAVARSARCATWVGAFDASLTQIWELRTSDAAFVVAASASAMAIEEAGSVELRALATGEIVERFALGGFVREARLLDDQTLVWTDAEILRARDASGSERWSLPQGWVVAVTPQELIVRTRFDVRVIDPTSGATRCRRLAIDGDPLNAPREPAAFVAALCEPAVPHAGRVRGAVLVDGRPEAGVVVRLADREVTTDGAGWFTVALDASGEVLVRPDYNQISRRFGGRCVLGPDVRVEVQRYGAEAHVLLELYTAHPFCPGGCDLVDCE